mgnify:FL=1
MRHLLEEQGLADQFHVESAGTGSWHVGEPPHRGSIQIADHHGIDIRTQRSQQLTAADVQHYDWLVAMDTSNRNGIRHLDRDGSKTDRIVLLLDYAEGDGPRDVPDPYYEGGFDGVYDLVYRGCEGLLKHILETR